MNDNEKSRKAIWYENPKLFFMTMTLLGIAGGFILYGALISVAGSIQAYEWKVKLPEIQPITLGSIMESCADEVGFRNNDDIQILKEWAACVKAKREAAGL